MNEMITWPLDKDTAPVLMQWAKLNKLDLTRINIHRLITMYNRSQVKHECNICHHLHNDDEYCPECGCPINDYNDPHWDAKG